MSKRTGASMVVRALEDEQIEFAFGIPGTHNIELYDVLGSSDTVRPILVTDEQSASFMADGAWRASGRMACVNVVPGAGLTHAMSGIAEAYLDNVPMLVLGCGIRRDLAKAYQLHDVDQAAMVSAVTKGVFRPMSGDEIYPTIREACRLARSGVPGPVFVEVPANLYLLKQEVGDAGAPERWTAPPLESPAHPTHEQVLRSLELIRGAKCPLIYVGAGAAGAADEVLRLVEALEAPVATTIQGKGVFPENHPLFLWPGFGDTAPRFVQQVAAACDLMIAVGCRFSEVGTGSYGLSIPGPLIHVDIDPEVPGRNFPAELPIVSDALVYLEAILAGLKGVRRPRAVDLRDQIDEGHAEIRHQWQARIDGERVNPQYLLTTLQSVLGPEAVFTTDSGNGTFLAMEALRLAGPGKFLAPVDYSCMGYSVPAAVGAKLARPDCPVVALAGDGAFLMTGLELLTAAQLGLGVMAFVLRDRELAQIAQFQSTAMNRKVASELPDYDLEGLARGMGVDFIALSDDQGVKSAVADARDRASAGQAVIVDVAIDYSQKTHFTRGIVKTNLHRLPLRDRVRFITRALGRKLTRR